MAAIESYNLLELHDHAVSLALQAGSYLRGQAAARSGVGNLPAAELSAAIKMSSVDIVTAADIKCEQLISEGVLARYTDHKIIGEESYDKGSEKRFLLDDDPTWIIDPLDGTVNFLHLFPQFAISIAVVIRKKPVVGVIYAPFASGLSSHPNDSYFGTLYSGAHGLGSFVTNVTPDSFADLVKPRRRQQQTCSPTKYSVSLPLLRPVPPLSQEAPKGCLFMAEWGKDRRDSLNSNLTRKVNSMWNMACETGGRQDRGGMVHGVRSLGSAALDMAYVATGAADIFWEAGCWEWDIAAGTCILQEAGGFVYPAQLPEGFKDDGHQELPGADLGGRLYLAVRPCCSTEDETARQAQDRVARQVWRRVERMDYYRPA